MPKIPYPYSHNGIYEVKRSLYDLGFKGREPHEGAKLVGKVKYWWDAETITVVGQGNIKKKVKCPAGYFYAYTYIYPKYKIAVKTNVVERLSSGNKYYDSWVAEKLGGKEETLG